jgi:putative flippase GtrA
MIFSKGDFWRAIIAGEIIAVLSLPILKNIKFFDFFSSPGGLFFYLFLFGWIIFLPLITATGLYAAYRLAVFKWPIVYEIGKYGIIGWMNVFVNVGVFNIFVLATGVARGWQIILFYALAFMVSVTHSFFWNRSWTFGAPAIDKPRVEYLKFFSVTCATSLINAMVLHLMVNVIGAPTGIDLKIWANISLAVLIPVSFFGNFFGYKIFVFKK